MFAKKGGNDWRGMRVRVLKISDARRAAARARTRGRGTAARATGALSRPHRGADARRGPRVARSWRRVRQGQPWAPRWCVGGHHHLPHPPGATLPHPLPQCPTNGSAGGLVAPLGRAGGAARGAFPAGGEAVAFAFAFVFAFAFAVAFAAACAPRGGDAATRSTSPAPWRPMDPPASAQGGLLTAKHCRGTHAAILLPRGAKVWWALWRAARLRAAARRSPGRAACGRSPL